MSGQEGLWVTRTTLRAQGMLWPANIAPQRRENGPGDGSEVGDAWGQPWAPLPTGVSATAGGSGAWQLLNSG